MTLKEWFRKNRRVKRGRDDLADRFTIFSDDPELWRLDDYALIQEVTSRPQHVVLQKKAKDRPRDHKEVERWAKRMMWFFDVSGHFRFAWRSDLDPLGRCTFDWKLPGSDLWTGSIFLNRRLVEHGYSWTAVKDVILHEIAHAMVGPEAGHNDEWKRACEEVGADPTMVP